MSKWIAKGLGILLFLLGIIFFFIPIPIGALMMSIAALMIFGDNPRVVGRLLKMRERSRRVDSLMDFLARWSPEFLRQIFNASKPEPESTA